MTLSIGSKQNCLFVTFVVMTAIGTFFLYRTNQQNWIFFREAEQKYANKEFAEAITFYNKSLEKGVPLSKIAVNLANSYVAKGEFQNAIDLYRKYLLEHPKDIPVRLEFARVLSYSGSLEESEKEYKKILEESYEINQSN